jgi:hypothetical protein
MKSEHDLIKQVISVGILLVVVVLSAGWRNGEKISPADTQNKASQFI